MGDRCPPSDRGERLTAGTPARHGPAERRRAPSTVLEVAAAITVLAVATALSALVVIDPKAVNSPLPMIELPLGLATGYLCRRGLGVVLLAVVVPLEAAQDYTNPFLLVMAAGPWLVGALLRDHRLLADQLRARSLELAAEHDIFAAESVRHERARIARELHDIVGHSLSVVVLQAAAGERLVGRSPEAAAQALQDIGRVARQAQDEIGALVALLTLENDDRVPLAVLAHRVVAAAAATGLDVTCRIEETAKAPPGDTSHTGYRVIQEAVTNALRHAPGAPIRLSLREDAGYLDVEVRNGSPTLPAPAAVDLGGGYGLQGMRDRVEKCQGTLDAGPLPGGGWRVRARLPLA